MSVLLDSLDGILIPENTQKTKREARNMTIEFIHHLIQVKKREALLGVLAQDPRPAYQKDPTRRYGLTFAGFDVRFTVSGEVLTVVDVVKA